MCVIDWGGKRKAKNITHKVKHRKEEKEKQKKRKAVNNKVSWFRIKKELC